VSKNKKLPADFFYDMLSIMSSRKAILLFLLLLTFFFGSKGVRAYYDPGYSGGTGGEGTVKTKQEIFEESVFGTNQFNQESHSYSNIENVVVSLNNLIGGCQTESCQEKLLGKSEGAIGTTTTLIGQLYGAPPASGLTYLADLGEKFNITSPVYAQGVGFVGLKPILDIWRSFRNIAYSFFVLVFIIIGFAIMFRVKISPQVVVTIQSSIPKVIVALILVTFSYAIAGLLIDLMYLVTALGVSTIGVESFKQSLAELFAELKISDGLENLNILTFSLYFWQRASESSFEIANLLNPVTAIANIFSADLPNWADKLIKTVTIGFNPLAVLLYLILNIILVFVFLKIFISLLLNYIKILLLIITAPLQLMLGAIPGFNTFGSWIKSLLVNLLPFSVIIILIALSAEILDKMTGNYKSMWMPPIIRPAIGSASANTVGAIFSFGILLLLSRVPDIIKSMFEKKPFEYGGALGQALGAPYMTAKRGLVGVAQTAETIDKALGTEGQPGWAARVASGIKRKTSTSGRPAITQRTPQQIAMQKRSPGRGGRGG
jgi:hypothetical protein